MKDILYLAWRYLAYHRLKTVVLVASMAIIVYLPLGLNILMRQSAKQLRGRAQATPLLVGAKGSPLELVLRSLYFETDEPASVPYAQLTRIEDSGLATAIPVYARFRTRHGPIVGTTLSYLEFRRLELAEGRLMAMLGECVVGSEVARRDDLRVGDHLLSSAEDIFNIAGVYPLKMSIVGILSPSDSPDDRTVFVDLKTTWIIEGLGHGHQDLQWPEAAEGLLSQEGDQVIANALVLQYNEITSENAATFHFHGDLATFPVTAIIAVPKDEKAGALLQGRYLGEDEQVQIVRPADVMAELLATVFTVGRYVTIAVLIVGLSALSMMSLVFLLSVQLRRRELETMAKIGGSRQRIASVVGAEVLGVFVLGLGAAAFLALVTSWFAVLATRLIMQMS